MVQDIRNEHTSLLGVGGARVLATETGEAGVFGKSRIVPGSGAICISQRQFGDKLILPMMKNYIEKYTPAGDFEKAKARVLVRGDLQKSIGETQGPVSRTESILILISTAIYHNLEVFKIDITAAYLNTPMNDDVKHKWLMLDRDVAKVLMSMDGDYWRPYLRRDGKILVKLDKIEHDEKKVPHTANGSTHPPTVTANSTCDLDCFTSLCGKCCSQTKSTKTCMEVKCMALAHGGNF